MIKVTSRKETNHINLATFDFKSLGYREMTEEEMITVNGGERIENSDAAVAAGSPGDVLTRNDGSEVVITQGDITAAQKKLGLTGSGGNPGEGNGGYSGGPSGSPQSPSETKQVHNSIQEQNQKTQQNSKESKKSYSAYFLNEDGAYGFGHALNLIYFEGKYFLFEINSIIDDYMIIKDLKKFGIVNFLNQLIDFDERNSFNNMNDNEKMSYQDREKYFKTKTDPNGNLQPDYSVEILSKSETKFPTFGSLKKADRVGDKNAGCIMRTFDSKRDVELFLNSAGYDSFIRFNTTAIQSGLILANAIIKGKQYSDYNLLGNNCGTWARDVLTSPGTGIIRDECFNTGLKSIIPNGIGEIFLIDNPNAEYRTITEF